MHTLSSPGQSTAARVELEAELSSVMMRELRAFLVDVERLALAPSTTLTASLLDHFTLGPVLNRWERTARSCVAPVARRFGILTDTDRAVAAHPYLGPMLERMRRSDLPEKAYSAARAVLTDATVQNWDDATTARALSNAMDAWTSTLVPGRDGPVPEGMSWAAQMRRIARTEATTAHNFHTLEQLSAQGYTDKRWVAHHDEITRDTHLQADGQTIPLMVPFIVGGEAVQVPGDPAGSPAVSYNCRCVIVGVNGSLTAGFNPDQVRVPKGNPKGGEWMDTPAGIGVAAQGVFADSMDERPYELDRGPALSASAFPMTAQQAEAARDLALQSSVKINTRPEGLAGIIKHDEIKNCHEVTSRIISAHRVPGQTEKQYNRHREEYERGIMGVPDSVYTEDLPVYGWFSGSSRKPSRVDPVFGSVTIELREEVKGRTTVTFGDSLDNKARPIWFTDLPGASSEQLVRASGLRGSYIEAQIHGNLGLKDIASVSMTAGDARRLRSQIAELQKRGIRVFVSGKELRASAAADDENAAFDEAMQAVRDAQPTDESSMITLPSGEEVSFGSVLALTNGDALNWLFDDSLTASFNPDQPRDSKGRWAQTMSVTQWSDMEQAQYSAIGDGAVGEAVAEYANGLYEPINEYCRHGGDPRELLNGSQSVTDYTELLDEGFDIVPGLPNTVLVYRGTRGFDPPSEFIENGFLSTSIDRRLAENFGKVVTIIVPKGTPVLTGNTGEHELIFPRGGLLTRRAPGVYEWSRS